MVYIHTAFFICPSVSAKNRPGFLFRKPGRFIMLYSCFLKPSRDHLRGFLIAAWAGAKITERSGITLLPPGTVQHFLLS